MTRRWFPMVAGAGALAVAALTAGGRGREFDVRLYRTINRERGPAGDRFFRAITELGSIWASAGAAIALVRFRRGRDGLDALGAAGAMWALGQVLKKLYARPRPYLALEGIRLLIERPRGTSWPSSHPAVILAFLTVASRDLDVSPAAKAGLAGVAGTVGLSRVWLGVHYPADVAGGLLLGRAVADLWSSLVSPLVIRRVPSVMAPVE
jgi:membrane-associated phospholipid phosphatase